MTILAVPLTPSTIGQFEVGDKYGYRGVVEEVSLTELKVCVADDISECDICKKDCPIKPKKSVEN